ncbi:MAG: V-type ATP synthase subunit D [Candidatus Scalindua sediminis]|nr:V-type ATP synthase subunit D [Candidatus Scalindua sediminis]
MKLHINATRMELLKLRKRLAIATRGHKLLNDKLEGLMREFLSMLKEYKGRRILVDRELPGIVKLFILAYVTSSKNRVIMALEQSKTAYKFTLKQRRILNVPIPYFSVPKDQSIGQKDSIHNLNNIIAYSFLDTNSELDNAITRLRDFFPNIIKLAEFEQSVRVVAKEIGKTRKRVNALEFSVIPRMKEDLKFIRNKLDEIERSNISRIMKIKDILGKG